MSSTATTEQTTAAPLAASDYRLPVWYFGFEGVVAGAFDLLHAYPMAWPALVLLVAANITVSLTMLRKRLKLAKTLWRGKDTRNVAIGLVALRLGSHFVLGAVGFGVTSTLGHVLFELVMAGVTVGLLAYCQEKALRALATAHPAGLPA